MATLYTIGHSTRSADELIALLAEHAIDCVVDVRTVPRSRTNPQFNTDVLPAKLAAHGIGYVHMAALGGLRGKQKAVASSPNTFWDNQSFRNYADYALTPPFREGLAALLALAADKRCAIMCAEAVWWRCHRRIITDYLLLLGHSVIHILGLGQAEAAKPNPAARLTADGSVIYPADPDAPSLFPAEQLPDIEAPKRRSRARR